MIDLLKPTDIRSNDVASNLLADFLTLVGTLA
ncbi:putative membrane protein, partial [Yersinia pestis PY-56]